MCGESGDDCGDDGGAGDGGAGDGGGGGFDCYGCCVGCGGGRKEKNQPQLSGFLEKGGWLMTTYKVGKVQ